MPKQICQSCAMPLRDDQQKGTEVNGDKSQKYCINCYKDGTFTWPDATAELMRVFCIGVLVDMHWPGFVARMATRVIPKLERWKKA